MSLEGIIDNKVKRGTLKLPASPVGLPTTPEDLAAYKDGMRRKYEEEQRRSMTAPRNTHPSNHEAERLLSSLENRVPVMDIWKISSPQQSPKTPTTTTSTTTTSVESRRVMETGDLASQMAMLDKELNSWEAGRKNTWGKSSSPYATTTTTAGTARTTSIPSFSPRREEYEREQLKRIEESTVTVRDDDLAALLKSLDSANATNSTTTTTSTTYTTTYTSSPQFDFKEETATVKSTNSLPTTLSTTSTTSAGLQRVGSDSTERLSALERLQLEQEAKLLEVQREAERVKREVELERQREKERDNQRIEREIQEKFERMQREEAQKSAAGALLCNFCFAPVGGAPYVRVNDKVYHADHFNCVVCGIALAGKSTYPSFMHNFIFYDYLYC